MIHLKNKLWCTLCEKPHTHEEILNCCEKTSCISWVWHFLKKTSSHLGHVANLRNSFYWWPSYTKETFTSDRYDNQNWIWIYWHNSDKTAKHPKASAAAGSMVQLERVELEMKAETVTTTKDKTRHHKTPMVETCPFEVRIWKLTTKEIKKYPGHKPTIRPCTIKPSENIIRSSPVTTRSMAKRKLNRGQKWHTISGHPSQLPTQQKSTFKVRRHILHRHKYKTYMKCRVKNCALSYIIFHTVKAINTHHHIYHSHISYKCQKCKKMI